MGFEVDVAGVEQFGAKLRTGVDADLVPQRERIAPTLTTQCFGLRSASPVVQDAANLYHRQRVQGIALLDTFIHNANVLAQAAQRIVDAYRHADALSDADLTAVMADAGRAVTQTEQAAEDARRQAEQAERSALLRRGGPA